MKTRKTPNKLLRNVNSADDSAVKCNNEVSSVAIVRIIVSIRLINIEVFVLFFLMACSRDMPAEPMCRVSLTSQSNIKAPAACLVVIGDKLLALQHNKKPQWTVPQQKRKNNRSAQCSAHQAVWKDTGLNVEVGALLFTDEHNMHFYKCHLSDDYAQALNLLEVPPWASRTVTKVAWVDPFATQNKEWSGTIDLITLRENLAK